MTIQTCCPNVVPEDKCSSDEEEEEEEEDEGSKEGEGEGEETATDATSSGPHLEPNTTAPQVYTCIPECTQLGLSHSI